MITRLRDFDGLIECQPQGNRVNPNEWLEHFFLGFGYEGKGKRLEAIAEYERAVEFSGGDHDAVAALGYAYAAVAKKEETRKILNDLEKKSKSSYVSPYMIAALHAALGEKDKAFESLDEAWRMKSMDISWHLKADLRIDSLRSDPRFENLLRRTGLN